MENTREKLFLFGFQLSEQKQETEQESDLFALESVERTSSVAAEHDSDLGNEQDLEEMDSQLNPGRKFHYSKICGNLFHSSTPFSPKKTIQD